MGIFDVQLSIFLHITTFAHPTTPSLHLLSFLIDSNFITLLYHSYGLPAIAGIPNGYSALAEIYGKGANRSPLLVAFGFPLDWVVTLPSEDVNGEDGTIQAGEYAKGDTATFFVVPNQSKVEVCLCFEFSDLILGTKSESSLPDPCIISD